MPSTTVCIAMVFILFVMGLHQRTHRTSIRILAGRAKFAAFLGTVLIGIAILQRESFLAVRTVYVKAYSTAAVYTVEDPSEGKLYSNLTVPKKGCVFDVGANDGVWNSNSFFLLNSKGYRGFLFEPDPEAFLALCSLYRGNRRVQLYNFALSDRSGVVPYRRFPLAHENTIERYKDNQYDTEKGSHHIAAVAANYLCELAERHRCPYSVLSVDAEGAGDAILKSLHCTFDVIIAESERSTLKNYSEAFRHGYNVVLKKI